MVQVPVRILPHGEGLPLPARATPGSAGMDLRAAVSEQLVIAPGARALVPCGIALAIPEGWEGQVRPRSGLAWRHGITVLNSPGTLDSDYRGEVLVPLVNLGGDPFTVARGDRIAQLVIAPVAAATLHSVRDLPPTESRHTAGFGSTGRD